MKKIILALCMLCSFVWAQNNYKYEITPMIAGTYTEGNMDLERNYANAGLSLGFNLDDSMFDQIELGFLSSIGKVDYKNSNEETQISRIFTNVIKEYSLNKNNALYALAGAGVEVYSNEAFNNETGLFVNYGVGYKYIFDNAMALKMDLRHLIEDDHGDNNLIYTVGLAIPFGEKSSTMPITKKEVQQPLSQPVVNDGDDDLDGVANSIDECPKTEKNTIVDTNGCAITVNLRILFDVDKAIIKPTYDNKLEGFAKVLNDYPSVKTTLHAHTDSTASESYNMDLSIRRANAVKKALTDLGIDAQRIKTIGYGETKPVATNETAQGRAKNRRVEATVNQ